MGGQIGKDGWQLDDDVGCTAWLDIVGDLGFHIDEREEINWTGGDSRGVVGGFFLAEYVDARGTSSSTSVRKLW